MANFITLSQAKEYLSIPSADTNNDDMLQNLLIPAACQALMPLVGDIAATQYTEYQDGGDLSVYLRHTPVVSVDAVIEGWPTQNYLLDFAEVDSGTGDSDYWSYSVDDYDGGVVSRRTAGNLPMAFQPGESNIMIIYTAGRENIPEAIQMATLELVRHYYTNVFQRSSGQADAYDAVSNEFTRSTGVTLIDDGIPESILALVRAFRRAPIIG
jgi:hypothetical protein